MDLSERVRLWQKKKLPLRDCEYLMNDLIADWKKRGTLLQEAMLLLDENEHVDARIGPFLERAK